MPNFILYFKKVKLFPVILVFPTSKILKWQLIYQQSRENVFCLYRYKFHWCTWTAYGKGNDIQASERSSRNQENKWWWTATHRGWYRVSKRFGVFLQIEAAGHGQVKIKKVMIVSGTMSAVDINRMPNNRTRYTITKRMPREWNYHYDNIGHSWICSPSLVEQLTAIQEQTTPRES